MTPKTSSRKNEQGNVFFALFGAVAIVGVLGAGIMSTMRGPLSTMVEVNRREQAKAEMRVAANLILAGAALDECGDADGFTEAPLMDTTGTHKPLNGGVIPGSIGATKTDPWGNPYGYCAWNHGPDAAGQTTCVGTLDGSDNANNIAIAIISSGPDGVFTTECYNDGVGDDYVRPDTGSGDDIVEPMTYNQAVASTGGLWAVSGPTGASIDRELTVTSAGTSSFTGAIEVGSTIKASTSIITDALVPINVGTQDYIDIAGGIKIGDVTVSGCTGVGDVGMLRVNGTNLQVCKGAAGWQSASGQWKDGAAGKIYYDTANIGVGTITDPARALDIGGTFGATGAATLGDTLNVSGATTLSSTLAVTGATTLSNTLAVAGDFTINTDKFTVDATNGDVDAAGIINTSAYYQIDGDTMLRSDTAMNKSVLLGKDAGANVTGNNNTILGANAASTLTSGSGNIVIGAGSTTPLAAPDVPGATTDDYLNIGNILHGNLTNKRLGIGFADDYDASGFNDTLEVNGNTDIVGNLAVSGTSVFGTTVTIENDGDIVASGTIAAADYTWNGVDFTPPGSCNATTEKMNWNVTTGWECIADTAGGSGAGGALNFIDLADVPNNYTGAGGKIVVVNAGATGLEFLAQTALEDAGKWEDSLVGETDDIRRNKADGDVLIGAASSAAVGIDANASSDLYVEGLIKTGSKILVPDGSAAAPSYVFTTSPTTGLYLDAADRLGFATAGVARAYILANGDVGIGTTSVPTGVGGAGQNLLMAVNGPLGATHYCDAAGENCFTAAGISSASTPAGADREIQFNNNGVFGASSTFKLMSDGDLLLTGTYTGTASAPVAGAGTRMFFDAQMGAFRAGSVDSTQWDTASIGIYSQALGRNAKAGGSYSTALGTSSNADAAFSLALGRDINIASSAPGSAGLGLNQNAATTDPIISGSESFGIFMGTHNNVNFAVANTMGVFGGKMVIDPAIPATQLTARGVLDLGAATDALILPRGTTAQQPVAPAGGMIRYNTTATPKDKVEYYDAESTSWIQLSDGTGGATPAGADREIQFNNNGVMGASAAYKLMADGDLLLTGAHTGTASVPVSGAGSRMFFDAQMSAFRAGYVNGTQWNDVNIGNYSTAFGFGTRASGDSSTAIGNTVLASGSNSTAIGFGTLASGSSSTAIGAGAVASGTTSIAAGASTTASGIYSIAMGRAAVAGDGTAGNGLGDGSMAIGLVDDSITITTKPKVTGIQSLGIFMGDQDGGVTLADQNTMGLFGGKMVIDPAVPATQLTARGVLDLGAATDALVLPSGTDAQQPAAVNGMLRYNTDNGKFEGYQAGAWQDILTSAIAGGAAAPDRGIQFNNNGDFAADAKFTYTTDGDLIVGSNQIDDTTTGTEDSRMYFDVSNSAFRAGSVTGGEWNFASAGAYSVAFGYNTIASGVLSFAGGDSSTATNAFSFAYGDQNDATGQASTAFGSNNNASGDYSIVFGSNNNATGGHSFAGGGDSIWATGDSSFAWGNSSRAEGDTSIAIGNNVKSSGVYGTAFGNKVVVGNGTAGSGFGDGSMAIGLIDDAVTITTRPQVTGIQSMGIFMGDQDGGVVLADQNTMGLFGGKMVIDPAVPATQLTARGVLDLGAATDALVLPSGTDAQRPGTPAGGMIRYNTTATPKDVIEYYDAESTAWIQVPTSTTSTPAGADREIQFNNAGVMGASATYKLMADGDLLLTGTYTGVASVPVSGAGTRMFFDTQTSAFRAGYVNGTQWNDVNIGNYSTAMGASNIASYNYAVALGQQNTSSGSASIALGSSNTATGSGASGATAIGYNNYSMGDGSMALGKNNSVTNHAGFAIGSYNNSDGENMALGFYADVTGGGSIAIGASTVDPATDPVISGAQSFGVFMGNHSGVDFSAANTAGFFGGKMVIDPAVPATQLTARGVLDLGAATDALILPSGTDAQRPGTPAGGMIRYNTTTTPKDVIEYYDAESAAWIQVPFATTAAPAGADREIQFNNAGVMGASAAYKLMSDGDLLLTGTYTGTASAPATGAGTRMFFDTQSAAFRAGGITAAQWDTASLGIYSVAFGKDTTASGSYSAAFGLSSTASGTQSFAAGNTAIASNSQSVSMGNTTTASGLRSVAMGFTTSATAASSVAMGNTTLASATNSVAMGNATQATGAHSVAMGSSTIASGSASTAMGVSTVASGWNSVAMGNTTTASGAGSVALGSITTASGIASTALGVSVAAGDGTANNGKGDGSIAFGLIDNAVTITTPSQVTGIQSMGIFMGDQDGLVVSADNQMGLFGGKMVIDPAIPATQLTARSVLDLGAATDALVLPSGTTAQQPVTPAGGMIRYNTTATPNDKVEYYDAESTSWIQLGSGGSGGAALSGITAAVAANTIGSGDYAQAWNWTLTTAAKSAMTFGETLAATNGAGAQSVVKMATLAASTAMPLWIQNAGNGLSFRVDDAASDTTPFVIDADGKVGIGLSAPTAPLHIKGANANGEYLLAMQQNDQHAEYIQMKNSAGTTVFDIAGSWGFPYINLSDTSGTARVSLTTGGAAGPHLVVLTSVNRPDGGEPYGFGIRVNYPNSMENGIIFGDGSGNGAYGSAITGYDGDSGGSTDNGGLRLKTGNGVRPTTRVQIDPDGITRFTTAGAIVLPSGTDAQRPGTPAGGMIRYNTTATPNDKVEYYDAESTSWIQLGSGGSGGTIDGLTDGITDYTTDFNLFMGQNAGAAIAATGQYNLAIGQNAGDTISSGDRNIAIGYDVLTTGATMSDNIGIGYNALKLNQSGGQSNVAIGAYALDANTTGDTSIAIGKNALGGNQGGGANIAIGEDALLSNVSGVDNVAIGPWALDGSTGDRNLGIGSDALTLTTGSDNIGIGYLAGNNLTSGSGNIIIGSSNAATTAGGSNQLDIGDTIYGDLSEKRIGIGAVPAAGVELDVTGDIQYTGTLTDVSDMRLKKNIRPLGKMLAKINQVKTYSFVMKDDQAGRTEFGVMAQEIETIFPELVRTAEDEMGTKSVNYIGLIAPIIEAVHDLSTENEALRSEINLIKAENTEVRESLASLSRQVELLNRAASKNIGQASMQPIAITALSLLLGLIALIGSASYAMRRKRG
ncbi:MAG: tail fiber domain-containing protein [Alphaproteobacteria bacterium]|nr:tail fiber domain-containing protein [Alphaproteobacteria bacterium]